MTAGALGQRRRDLREGVDVTTAELAIAAGIGRGTPGAIERGKVTRETMVRRLVAALALVAPAAEIDVDAQVAALVEAAGGELAGPSEFLESAAHAEWRRDAKAAPQYAVLLREARQAKAAMDRALKWDDFDEVARITHRVLARQGIVSRAAAVASDRMLPR